MEIFAINDIDGFIKAIRNGAAESITESYSENLDDFITTTQIETMLYAKTLGQDENGLYLINEDIFDQLFEEIRSTIYQIGLAKLAAKDIIQCAWDENANEMVFWTKNLDDKHNVK